MPFPVHPHMLRHGCGYALANAGHDTRALQAYLGYKNIQHTVRYTESRAGSVQELLAQVVAGSLGLPLRSQSARLS
jgi:site-specific recombinase XerD